MVKRIVKTCGVVTRTWGGLAQKNVKHSSQKVDPRGEFYAASPPWGIAYLPPSSPPLESL